MDEISIPTWPRNEHFRFFNRFAQPQFGMCANVDVSRFYPLVKERGCSFTVAVIYLIARAANAIPEFRQRIRNGQVVEHPVVHPSTTILMEDNLFTFCSVAYSEDFADFSARAEQRIAYVRQHPSLEDGPGQDNLLFMSPIPWVTFTSFTHPLPTLPADSIPRFAWGKRFAEGGSLKMPLAVQAHHALMDGLHMAYFYAAVQEFLSQPEMFLGNQGS